MTARTLRPFAPLGKRTAAGRFAEVEQALRDEEIAALRAAVLSTGLRDRSAVPAVAELLGVEESTVYNALEGRTKRNPIRDFFAFVDACLVAKGNDNALEPVRLAHSRYLVPVVEVGAEQRTGASLLREAGEAVSAWSAMVDSCPQPGEAAEARRQLDDLIRVATGARDLAARLETGAHPVPAEIRR